MADSGPDSDAPPDLLQVRMVAEFAYCPRLFHLMHVDGLWADNAFTEDGKRVHRRVDRLDQVLPGAPIESVGAPDEAQPPADEGETPPEVRRSVMLGSQALGIVGRLDLVAVAGNEAVPVETKRGSPPGNPERSYEPARVQVMAQGLLLREHGYVSTRGILYYAGARRRVEIPFTPDLEARTLRLIEEARGAARRSELPKPLVDSPKCFGCSLNGICLPDETLALQEVPADGTAPEVRRLYPAREEARPFYVQEQGARVGKKDSLLVITKEGEVLAEARLRDVSQLVLCGNIGLSAQALHVLCEAEIPIVHLSMGHWFYGVTRGFGLRNAFDRAAQFRLASDPAVRLLLAKTFVAAKGMNQRTLLRRNAEPVPEAALDLMARTAKGVEEAESIPSLLGLEGTMARAYFGEFRSMLRPPSGELAFDFEGRNSRPPKDPVNALLSFGYAMLAKECAVALLAAGLDPHWGFFHEPRHGKPALALDLMEEFRPLVVDSAVITAINTGMLTPRNFTTTSRGCVLGPEGRKSFIRAYESRLGQLATHPIFQYRCSWRQMIALQARILARYLRGDSPRYTSVTTR
jgi:CRISPR-associated protein Cas1